MPGTQHILCDLLAIGLIAYSPGGKAVGQMGPLGGLIQSSYF